MVMSAIYRSGQRFGAGHIVDIVYGARTARISALGHDQLKTYGVGRDRGKRFWRQFIDGMLAQGLLKSEGDPYPVLQISAAGEEVLFGRAEFVSHQMLEETGSRSEGALYDESLFALLKKKRRDMAEEAGVPPYVLFSDKSLHQMSSLMPQSPEELLAINGVGQVKCERYGRPFLEIITRYRADNPEAWARQTSKAAAPTPARKQLSGPTLDETLRLAETGMSVEAIAAERQLKPSTIASHIGEILQQGRGLDVDHYVDQQVRNEMTELFRVHGLSRLKPIVEGLEGRAGYEQANIVRGFLMSQGWKIEEVNDDTASD
jgi:ATP-dependent DNA helicase RecQ